jgi:hypothetical protein
MLHALRLANPTLKAEAWHAAVAGAVSGLAVWAEKPSRRVTIAQQMLVRSAPRFHPKGYPQMAHFVSNTVDCKETTTC